MRKMKATKKYIHFQPLKFNPGISRKKIISCHFFNLKLRSCYRKYFLITFFTLLKTDGEGEGSDEKKFDVGKSEENKISR